MSAALVTAAKLMSRVSSSHLRRTGRADGSELNLTNTFNYSSIHAAAFVNDSLCVIVELGMQVWFMLSLFQGLKRHVESVHEKLDKYRYG